MMKCRCCRQSWPLEFYPTYTMRGVEYRRIQCLACRKNCPGRQRRKVAATRERRSRLRSEVRLARARRESAA